MIVSGESRIANRSLRVSQCESSASWTAARDLAGRRDDRDLVDLVEALQAGARTGTAVAADVQAVTAATTDVTDAGAFSSFLSPFAGLRLHDRALGRADVDDEAARAAVVEEAVDRVSEVLAAVLEIAERLHELRPVRDEDGLVQRALGRLTEETDGVGTDGLDGLGSAIDFFDVDAW